MAKVFEIDFRNGTLIDSVGNIEGVLGSGVYQTAEKGLTLYNDKTNEGIKFTKTIDLSADWSLETWVKIMEGNDPAWEYVVGISSSGLYNHGFVVALNRCLWALQGGGASDFSFTDDLNNNLYKYKHVVVTHTSRVIRVYIDNTFDSGNTSPDDIISPATAIFVLGA